MGSVISPKLDSKAPIMIPGLNHCKSLGSIESFPFQKFPPEIRCMVWRMTFSEPRIVTYRKTPLPLALQINKESRYEAQKLLTLLFSPDKNYGAYKLRNRNLTGYERLVLRPTYIQPGIDILEVQQWFVPDKLLKHPHLKKAKAVLVHAISDYFLGSSMGKVRIIVQIEHPRDVHPFYTLPNIRRPEFASRAQVMAELNSLE